MSGRKGRLTKFAGLVAAIFLGFSQSAGAQTLEMSGFASSPALTFEITGSPYSNVYAGGFNAVYTPDVGASTSFIAYCIDLSQSFSWNTPFAVAPTSVSSLFGEPRATALDRLYTQHFADVDTGIESAAFQLAIWEIVTDTGGSGYDLASGVFTASATSSTNANDLSAIGTAASWLGNLGSGASGGYTLTALVGESNQDQLMASPVPEPQTYAMLMAGLGLLGFVARRRLVGRET